MGKGGGFTLPIVADVRGWLKGMSDLEQSVDDAASDLDKFAANTAADAEKAAEGVSGDFTKAMDKVRSESKTAGDAVGDNIKRGSDEASEGTKTFKENANQNAKEVAASFDGSAQSIADGFQGLAAEAFEGFGPAGVAAGVAVAAGIGLASTALTQADEDAEEAKKNVQELGKSLATATTRAQGLADAVADAMSEAVKNPQNIVEGLFGGGDSDRLTLYSDVIRNAGLDYGQVLKAMAGDDEVYQQVVTQAWANTDQAHEQSTISFMDDLNKRNQAFKDAQEWAKVYAESEVAAAQRAANAAATFGDTLSGSLGDAASDTSSFVKDSKTSWKDWNASIKTATDEGTLDVDAWLNHIKQTAKDNEKVIEVSKMLETKLSPEAYQEFEKLPAETQVAIAKAYKTGSKAKIEQGLEISAGTPTVKNADETKSKAETAVKNAVTGGSGGAKGKGVIGVDVDAKVTSASSDTTVKYTAEVTGAETATNTAANAAQSEANKDSNKITFNTRIDHDELQRQVNRAAASITPPTITVKTRVQKEVP